MLSPLRWVRQRVGNLQIWFASLSTARRAVLLAAVAYAFVMSGLTVAKFYTLRTYAWDLGSYSQSLWTTAFQGRFFYYTPDLPNNPSGSIFGAHFAPFLALLVPVYAAFPFPPTLLVLQSCVIAGGSWAVFRLAAARLKAEGIAALLALAYLLNPAVQAVNWFDFHPEAFMMVFLLATLVGWEERAWGWFGLFMALALSTLEMAGVLVAVLGLFWAIDLLRRHPARTIVLSLEFRVAVAASLLGIASSLLGLGLLKLVNPGTALLGGGTDYWQVLGAHSLLGVPVAVVADPARFFAAITYDGLLKLWYLVLLFAPLAFWPMRRPLCLLLLAPWLVPALTSNFPFYYGVGAQYTAFVVPFLFYGSILGLDVKGPVHSDRRLGSTWWARVRGARLQGKTASKSNPLPLAVFSVVFLLVASPVGPLSLGVYTFGGFPSYTSHDSLVLEVAGLVPPRAAVLTQNNLFSLFADRSNAYVIPSSTYFMPGDSFNRSLRAYLNESQFVFLDLKTSLTESLVVLVALRTESGFGVVAAADGAILVERGYVGPPRLFVPFNETYRAGDLALLKGTRVADPAASGGFALASVPLQQGAFWTGPAVFLWPGTYTIGFRVRADPVSAGTIATLAFQIRPGFVSVLPRGVSSSGSAVSLSSGLLRCTENLSVANLTGADLPNPAAYVTVRLPLTVDLFGAYNFSGYLPGSSSTVYLDEITATQDSSTGYIRTEGSP